MGIILFPSHLQSQWYKQYCLWDIYSSSTTWSRPEQKYKPRAATANRQQVKSEHPGTRSRWTKIVFWSSEKDHILKIGAVLYLKRSDVPEQVTAKEFSIFRWHHKFKPTEPKLQNRTGCRHAEEHGWTSSHTISCWFPSSVGYRSGFARAAPTTASRRSSVAPLPLVHRCRCSMRGVAGVLLPLVTLYLLKGMLERREKRFHALRHSIWVARHVDDLKRITNSHDQWLGGPKHKKLSEFLLSCSTHKSRSSNSSRCPG